MMTRLLRAAGLRALDVVLDPTAVLILIALALMGLGYLAGTPEPRP